MKRSTSAPARDWLMPQPQHQCRLQERLPINRRMISARRRIYFSWPFHPGSISVSLSVMAILLVTTIVRPVHGKWYSQICPTGSVEAVTIDTDTGRLIFVNYGSGSNDSSPFVENKKDSSPPSVIVVADDTFTDSSPTTESSNGNDAATPIPAEKDESNHNRSFLRRSLTQISSIFSSRALFEEQYESSPAWRIPKSQESSSRVLRSMMEDNTSEEMDATATASSTNVTTFENYKEGEIFFIRPCLCYNGANRYSSSASSSPDATTTSASSSTAAELYLCNAEATYCGVPLDGNDQEPVACYAVKMQQVVARNAWPLILLWYLGLLVICLCTINGHTAGEYIKSLLLGNYNERFLDRMLESDGNLNASRHNWWSWQRHRFEQNLMLQIRWIWRHEEYQRELRRRQRGLPAPQLELKVKRWTNQNASTDMTSDEVDWSTDDVTPLVSEALGSSDASSEVSEQEAEPSMDEIQWNSNDKSSQENSTRHANDEKDDDGVEDTDQEMAKDDQSDVNSYDEPSCTICFAPLEEGDRIGDLPCKHEFHVNCLKTWVQRKNACPLCNVPIGSRTVPAEVDEDSVDGEENNDGQRRRTNNRFGASVSTIPPEQRRIGLIGVIGVSLAQNVDADRRDPSVHNPLR